MSVSGSLYSNYTPLLVIGSGIIGSLLRYYTAELYLYTLHRVKHKHTLLRYLHNTNYPVPTLTGLYR